MCPFCLTTAAIIAGSATGSGGLTVVIARKFRKITAAAKVSSPAAETTEVRYGNEPYGSASPESGAACGMD
jgi:hypothetical protein